MKGTKIKYLIILALAVFDLVALFILLLYCSARIDREAIEELDELFKAMKRLDQLKKHSDDEPADSTEKSRTHG